MPGVDSLRKIVSQHKNGIPAGIYSICSSHPYVLRASLRQAYADESELLIEATSNQVNQFGGYTGMTPEQFKDLVLSMAKEEKLHVDRIILGGDHLGPIPFKNEHTVTAMEKAKKLVKEFVRAGFSKIHLDTSVRLGDDAGTGPLDPELIASRCADLCVACEETVTDIQKQNPEFKPPLYVIGTEVPVPGGSDEVEGEVHVTDVADFENTVSMTKHAFYRIGLEDTWERVIAVVVQPGVEFGDRSVLEYNREKTSSLSRKLREYENIVFEAHSTDYQTPDAMKQMVENGFAILKVGPGLTYAFREAVYMLGLIEKELSSMAGRFEPSYIMDVVDAAMKKNPAYWEGYYTGTETEKAFKRKFSLFDRIRYYWNVPEVHSAFKKLLQNLRKSEIPLTLLSQFFPSQYLKVRTGELDISPDALIIDKVREVVAWYAYAAGCLKQR